MGTDVERMIAVLHDVLEDTSVTVDELHRRGCPPEVIEAVEVLIKRREESYDAFIGRIRDSRNELAVRVKLADIADNADERRLSLLDPAEAQRLRSKYSDAGPLLLGTTARDASMSGSFIPDQARPPTNTLSATPRTDLESGEIVAEKLREYGARRELVRAAELGYVTDLTCAMPECLCPEELGGKTFFEPKTRPLPD